MAIYMYIYVHLCMYIYRYVYMYRYIDLYLTKNEEKWKTHSIPFKIIWPVVTLPIWFKFSPSGLSRPHPIIHIDKFWLRRFIPSLISQTWISGWAVHFESPFWELGLSRLYPIIYFQKSDCVGSNPVFFQNQIEAAESNTFVKLRLSRQFDFPSGKDRFELVVTRRNGPSSTLNTCQNRRMSAKIGLRLFFEQAQYQK